MRRRSLLKYLSGIIGAGLLPVAVARGAERKLGTLARPASHWRSRVSEAALASAKARSST